MIPEHDIELVESLAQLGSAQFASDLRAVLEAVRAISVGTEVRHLHVDVSFDFATWTASPLDEMSVHLCQCEACDKERASVAWKEEVLDASKIRRVLGGISVATDQHVDSEDAWVAGALQEHSDENLQRLVDVTHALESAGAIRALAAEIRRFVTVAPVDYFGFYLIVDVADPRDVTDVVFHWCDQEDCEADPVVGRRRPTTLGQHGLPQTVRLCGHSSEHVRRSNTEQT